MYILACVILISERVINLSQQQPRQGVQVSHIRVVAEDAVDSLLLVGEDVVQLPLQL